MAGFWEHYAKANDSIRTELIDKAWFNQQTGGQDFENNVKAMAEQNQDRPDPEPDLEPTEGADIHGNSPEQAEEGDSGNVYRMNDSDEADVTIVSWDVPDNHKLLEAPEQEIEQEL